MKKEKESIKKWFYYLSLALAIIVLYNIIGNFTAVSNWIKNLFSILMPFGAGLLIAYILYIPSRNIESKIKKSKNKFFKKHARVFSVFIVYLISFIIIVSAIAFIVPAITESIKDLINNFGTYYSATIEKARSIPENPIINKENIDRLTNAINEIDLNKYLDFEKITEYAKGAISAVSSVFDFFVAIIVSIYILAGRARIKEFFKKLGKAIFKEKTYDTIAYYFNRGNEIFFKFLFSQLLDAVVVGILTSVAMSILGVKYAVLLGCMIGLFNLIPYFGAIIAVIISIIVTLLTGGIGQAVWMGIIVTILQQIDANIINPKITGNSLKVSPLLVIFAVTIGGAYFGVLGMFLAVPVATIIKLMITDFIDYRNKKEENKEVS